MAITSLDGVVNALGNSAQPLIINKASIATQLAGGFSSLWRATGVPAQGAIPGAAAICTKALTGALPFSNPTGGASSYLGRAFLVSGNSGTDVQVHDRLGHMGGLNGTLTTSQPVNLDISGTGNNLAARRGTDDYSHVQWWVEIYSDIGTTARTLTVTYTRAPGGIGNTGRTLTIALGGASPANQDSRLFLLTPPAGEYIQSVESVQLDVSTGTAGSFGITATKSIGGMSLGLANSGEVYDWAQLGFPNVPDDACLFPIVICGTTSTGTLYGNLKLVQG
jgi:hypothetical protein